MTDIRVTRFSRSTRYAVVVPNDQQFKFRVIKRVARTTTKAQAVQLRLPLL
jgi:hypothetical protein